MKKKVLSDVLPEMELFLKFHYLMWNKLMKMNSSRQVGVGQDCLLSWTVPQRNLKKTRRKRCGLMSCWKWNFFMTSCGQIY